MKKPCVWPALALATFACGKQTFLAAAMVQTPALANPVDPRGPAIPAMVVLSTYLGTIDTSDPTKIDASKIGTLPGAKASVAFRHVKDPAVAGDANEDRILAVAERGNGQYALSSADNAKLTFEKGVPYTLVLETPGQDEAFGARLTPGEAVGIREFASGGVLDQAVGAPLVVTRTDAPAAGDARLPAFILVAKVDPQNPKQEPVITFKTVPDSALKLLKFVLSDQDYRWASYTIDAAAFPSAGYYAVTVLAVKTGKVSENAFIGSTALAGAGSAAIVHAH